MSVSTVEASHTKALTAAAAQLGTTITELDTLIADQRRSLDDLETSWRGQASTAAIANGEADLLNQTALRERMQAMQSAVRSGGNHLSSAREAVLTVVTGLRAVG